MQEKADIYADKILPLMEQIFDLCAEHDIPMLFTVCLGQKECADGLKEMMLSGSNYLECRESAPEPMKLAAGMLSMPGFEAYDPDNQTAVVH